MWFIFHFNIYPFHIAKATVTPHLTPFSINTPVCFSLHTEHRISAFWRVRFKKRSEIECFLSMHAVHTQGKREDLWPFPPHYLVHHFTLTTAPSQTAAFGQNTLPNASWGSSRPPTSNAAFLTPVSNNAASERSHQIALFSKRLWLRIIGLIWKGYQSPLWSKHFFHQCCSAWIPVV